MAQVEVGIEAGTVTEVGAMIEAGVGTEVQAEVEVEPVAATDVDAEVEAMDMGTPAGENNNEGMEVWEP